MNHNSDGNGFTLVEVVIALVVLTLVMLSTFSLFISLTDSADIAKEIAVASTLANNQMEYLKSLPYASLAVAGGNIYSSNPLPASVTKTVDGMKYTVYTTINYVDNAYDGCGSYPNLTLEEEYCRNYPPPSGAPSIDKNPEDYKIVHVSVKNNAGTQMAQLDTEIAGNVAETASTTGALFVSVIDDNGNPVTGATVTVSNSNVTPSVDASESTDNNGIAIFYGLPPDTTNFQYKITASKDGYSSLNTLPPSGTLQPTYSNQNILTQQSSYVTLTIKPEGMYSLLAIATNTQGNPIPNAKLYVKGGYKKYTATSNTAYYYDNMSPTDSRPTTDSNGMAAFTNLVPGTYIFCGNNGSTGCTVNGTTYYAAAVVPYGGNHSLNPIVVPDSTSITSTSTTYPYNGQNYYQKVDVILTSSATSPRITSISPSSASLSSGTISNYAFSISGENLPCSNTASSCGTTVVLSQNGTKFPVSCTGSSTGIQLSCTSNLSAASTGSIQVSITANGQNLTLPTVPLGGINVTQ